MSSPLLTVCLPTYNYERYLEQAVRSVWDQTYQPRELVVVDDGSADGSWALLERLLPLSPIPMKVLQGGHRGVSAAMNMAARAARGEWLAILAADDYARRDRLERQVAAVDSPAVLLVHSEYVCVDEHGRATGYDSSSDLPPASGRALRDILLLRADVRSVTMMLRRSALEKVGGYDERKPAEDWQSILRLARDGEIRHVPEPLVYRRVHGSNVSIAHQQKQTRFSFDAISIDVVREVAPPDLDLDRLAVLHASTSIKNSLAQGGYQAALDGFRQCWDRFPSQRALLVGEFASGLRSWLWLQHVRRRLPPGAVKALVRLKVRARALRVTSTARPGGNAS